MIDVNSNTAYVKNTAIKNHRLLSMGYGENEYCSICGFVKGWGSASGIGTGGDISVIIGV